MTTRDRHIAIFRKRLALRGESTTLAGRPLLAIIEREGTGIFERYAEKSYQVTGESRTVTVLVEDLAGDHRQMITTNAAVEHGSLQWVVSSSREKVLGTRMEVKMWREL